MSRLRLSLPGQLFSPPRAALPRNHRSFLSGARIEGLEDRVVLAADTIPTAMALGDFTKAPAVQSGAITSKDHGVLYTFQVTGTFDQVIHFVVADTSSAANHFGVYVFRGGVDAGGNPQALEVGGSGGDDITEELKPGTYYVFVSTGVTASVITGNTPVFVKNDFLDSYTLTVQAQGVTTAQDPGSTFQDAVDFGPVGSRSSVGDRLETPTDVDMYKVTLKKGQELSLELDTPGPGLAVFRLFAPEGEIGGAKNKRGPDQSPRIASGYTEFDALVDGTYYVGVSGAGNSRYDPTSENGRVAGKTGFSYKLTILDLNKQADPGSTVKETNLPLARIATGRAGHLDRLERSTDVDMYKVRVAKPGAAVSVIVRLGLSIATPTQNLSRIVARMFDSNGVEVAQSEGRGSQAGGLKDTFEILRYRFPKAGAYYIGVSFATNVEYNAVTGAGRKGLFFYDANLNDGAYRINIIKTK